MSLPSPTSSNRPRLADPRQLNKVDQLPDWYNGRESGPFGSLLEEQDYALTRSPGPFAVRIGTDGRSVIIGENWVGPESEAQGGLEGCTTTSPGMLTLTDGRVMLVGGEVAVTAASMVANCLEDNGSLSGQFRCLLVAMVPALDSSDTSILYHAVLLNSSPLREQWLNYKSFIPPVHQGRILLPIALLRLHTDGIVLDVVWSREEPACQVGGSGGGGSSAGAAAIVQVTGPSSVSPYYHALRYGGTNNLQTFPIAARFPGVTPFPMLLTHAWVGMPRLFGVNAGFQVTIAGTSYDVWDVAGLLIVV